MNLIDSLQEEIKLLEKQGVSIYWHQDIHGNVDFDLKKVHAREYFISSTIDKNIRIYSVQSHPLCFQLSAEHQGRLARQLKSKRLSLGNNTKKK